MDRPTWVPDTADADCPSMARVYDYLLGGSHNLAVDRQLAEQLLLVVPEMRNIMRANRSFLRRAVRFMVGEGVRQFLDIGSGIPTVGNVHEVAKLADPSARIAYVDNDPVAVAQSRAMLAGVEGTTAVQGDLRSPNAIVESADVRSVLDFDEPIGLLIVAVLHFVPDADNPSGALEQLRDALPSGSHLALSHATADSRPTDARQVAGLLERNVGTGAARSYEDVCRFFGDFTMVPPGLVWVTAWRPESPAEEDAHPERLAMYAGVGRKA